MLQNIRQLRESRGLSQARLSSLSGVSVPYIQQIEYGKGNPSVETLQKILDVFGIELCQQIKPLDYNLLAQIGVPISHNTDSALAKELVVTTAWHAASHFTGPESSRVEVRLPFLGKGGYIACLGLE